MPETPLGLGPVAAAAIPVFRRSLENLLPKAIHWAFWLVVGKWILKILLLALEAGDFAGRAMPGATPVAGPTPAYSPETIRAIADLEVERLSEPMG